MRTAKAFTLIELLVVVAIIVILIAILVPSLEKAMAASYKAKCLTSMKGLATAWRTYSSDNKQAMVGPGTGEAKYDWVYRDDGKYNPELAWEGQDDTLGYAYITDTNGDGVPDGVYGENNNIGGSGQSGNINQGDTQKEKQDDARKQPAIDTRPFYKYTAGMAMYKCPLDPRSGYLRTYSISDSLGGLNWVGPSIKNVGEIERSGDLMLFVEESDPRGYNVGAWVANDWNGGGKNNWIDPIADYHNHSSNITFADGHGETRVLVDKRSWNQNDIGSPEEENNPDLLFYQRAFRLN